MLAIIDYGVGNLTSVLNMFSRIGVDACITGDPAQVEKADRILIPGVGNFDKCMQNFNASGLRKLVEKKAHTDKIPVLGICVGAQMMTRGSEEGREAGLGWIDADTVRFRLDPSGEQKVPHMGWSDLIIAQEAPLWTAMPEEPRFYFAHSYHFVLDDDGKAIGRADYGYEFVCAFRINNIFGVQFHPEKSHRFGMRVLANFAA
ncbi:MAG TPA: imidazole glycerol phosphate synthase subunit HisH, partial [Puia sp.]|nr:imidazole glycerol phosphate synthase subunit HisH [Puia sp.]